MSSLIFFTDTEQALVVTDTLAVNPDGTPKLFASKATYIPHLQLIVAGTGLAGFSGDWANRVNFWMLVDGIENLDRHAPGVLREMWAHYVSELQVPEEMTTTVYHFGFSEVTGEMMSFAYRSTSDFRSERVQLGVGVKPECSWPDEGNFLDHIEGMMLEQRANQATKPAGERLYIGGEAFATHLTKTGFSCWKLFDFADREEHQMLARKALESNRQR